MNKVLSKLLDGIIDQQYVRIGGSTYSRVTTDGRLHDCYISKMMGHTNYYNPEIRRELAGYPTTILTRWLGEQNEN